MERGFVGRFHGSDGQREGLVPCFLRRGAAYRWNAPEPPPAASRISYVPLLDFFPKQIDPCVLGGC